MRRLVGGRGDPLSLVQMANQPLLALVGVPASFTSGQRSFLVKRIAPSLFVKVKRDTRFEVSDDLRP